MSHRLDNPVWHALVGPHAQLAIGRGRARHYPRDVAPFSAIEEPTTAAYADLAADLAPNTEARLFRPVEEPFPEGWLKVDAFPMLQIVARRIAGDRNSAISHVVLTARDVDAMMGLVTITNPGPFGARTCQLGTYLGVRENGCLVAMAGERMRGPGYVELSAICTHPDARGRGLAAHLTRQLMRAALDRGEIPFLHVRVQNEAAISLYERVGFAVRREIWVLWRKPAAKAS